MVFFSFKGCRLGHAQAWGQRRCGVPQEAPEGESAHAEEASASWRRDGRHGGRRVIKAVATPADKKNEEEPGASPGSSSF